MWLHGFTQTRDSAHLFRTILAGTYEVVTLDLPGHGRNAAIEASLVATADLLAEVLPREPFILGGYSFGARVALHFALCHPERLHRLVLLGATRGIEDPSQRVERRQRDDAIAERVEMIGADRFLDEWLAQPMFQGLPPDPRERAARSSNAHGLATSLRRAGTGTQEWLGPRMSKVLVPTLTLAGSDDVKFSVEANAIAAEVVNGRSGVVGSAGHAAHLERPEESARLVIEFQRQ